MTDKTKTNRIQRREFLGAMGATGAVTASAIASPAIAQGRREVRMVTAWPNDFPGLGTSATRIAERITIMSGGSLAVKVFPADTLVSAFESFDAVSNGDAEAYHAIEYYWQGKSSAFSFFAGVPFGLTASEMNTWIYAGGGQLLWDKISSQYNLKPFLAGNIGTHMAGWFTKPIRSIDDFRGMRVAIAGLGGNVFRRMGASAQAIPGREILPALRSGKIDAADWFGPWIGMAMGFQNVAKYHYFPGFQEPGTALSCVFNLEFWKSLTISQQQVVEAATASENAYTLAEFNARNAEALHALEKDFGIRPTQLPNEVLQALGTASGKAVSEAGRNNPRAAEAYSAFIQFRHRSLAWSKVSEHAYLNARLLPFAYSP
jgi:TRAP-type mannitol/chloroaromatic compound transport system substrate-binding protein